jgi:hypothetical protein
MIQMPLSEIVDRYTIAILRVTRCTNPEDVERAKQLVKHLEPDANKVPRELVMELLELNRRIWSAEASIRNGTADSTMTLEEIGKAALNVRALNRQRCAIKARIIQEYEPASDPFREVKVNYGPVSPTDYSK